MDWELEVPILALPSVTFEQVTCPHPELLIGKSPFIPFGSANMANLFTLWAFILSFLPPAGTPTSSALQSYQAPITLATCSVKLYGVGVGFASGLRRFWPQAPIHKTAPGHFLANPDDTRVSSGSQFVFKTSSHSELLFASSSSNRVYSELLIAT